MRSSMGAQAERGAILRWVVGLIFGLPIAIVLGLNLSFQLPGKAPVPDPAATVGYFAYGSNMNDRYFTRVRGIDRAQSRMAALADYAVTFDLDGMPPLEPAFANLTAAPGAMAYGVYHRLREDEFARIIDSEGDAYAIRDVTVTFQDGSTAQARTLISKPSLVTPALPSRRYLNYMHEAALHYEMPPEVVERYDPAQGAYFPVLSECFGALIQTAVWVFART